MPIALTCPSCRGPVEAADADRGTTIPCGTCSADVPVPARMAPLAARPATAVPVAKAIPARPAAAAPVAAARAAPAAKVVPAGAVRVVAAAAADRKEAGDRDDVADKPRSRRRDSGVDPDDDRADDRPRAGKKGNKTLLIVLGSVGGVMLLGCAGVGYLITSAVEQGKELVESAATAPPSGPVVVAPGGTDPFAGPATKAPDGPKKPFWESEWKPVPKADGFTASAPKSGFQMPDTWWAGNQLVAGFQYEGNEANVTYFVKRFDLPADVPLSAEEFARKARLPTDTLEAGPTPVTIGGVAGTEMVWKNFAGLVQTVRAAKVGCRVFLFGVGHYPKYLATYPGLDLPAKTKQYFDSIQITFDPATPAPQSKAPKSRPPVAVAPPAVAPTPAPPKTPDPDPPKPEPVPPAPSPAGGLKLLAKIDPFTAAVSLPQTKEVLTFGVRNPGPKPAGVARRYAAADFKLVASYDLPAPVIHAVADEKAGRLYVATATKDVTGYDTRERLTAVGDLQSYDLKPLLSAPAGGELKPAATAPLGAKVASLDLAPDGKTLYAVTVALSAATAKGGPKARTKLLRVTAADLKTAAAMDLPAPVILARLSPDGKTLVAADHPFNPFGYPTFGAAGGAGNLYVVDVAGWKKPARAVPLPGPASDLLFFDDAKAVAVVPAGPQSKLIAVDARGATADAAPAGGLRLPAGFAALSDDGARLVLAARAGTGVEVLAVVEGAARLKAVAYAAVVPGALAAGPVVLTPDDKAAYATGAVVDLTPPADQPGE